MLALCPRSIIRDLGHWVGRLDHHFIPRHILVLQCLPEKLRELKGCMELTAYAKLNPSHWGGSSFRSIR